MQVLMANNNRCWFVIFISSFWILIFMRMRVQLSLLIIVTFAPTFIVWLNRDIFVASIDGTIY
ncbi:hypothetical protein AWJ07_14535 [Shewanella frigidimarina]|uniref:Uncharacterized protein n=1 Tax=Shewanella frigidimarina TaxID=56812 RepID=A0A119D050_SHEFR|nr:hypothetical protein AWJ07_14535 [Shewanella frigidimarina]